MRTVRGNVIWENNIDARNERIIGKETTFSFGELSSDGRRLVDNSGAMDERAIRRAALVTVRRLRYLAPPGLLSVAG